MRGLPAVDQAGNQHGDAGQQADKDGDKLEIIPHEDHAGQGQQAAPQLLPAEGALWQAQQAEVIGQKAGYAFAKQAQRHHGRYADVAKGCVIEYSGQNAKQATQVQIKRQALEPQLFPLEQHEQQDKHQAGQMDDDQRRGLADAAVEPAVEYHHDGYEHAGQQRKQIVHGTSVV